MNYQGEDFFHFFSQGYLYYTAAFVDKTRVDGNEKEITNTKNKDLNEVSYWTLISPEQLRNFSPKSLIVARPSFLGLDGGISYLSEARGLVFSNILNKQMNIPKHCHHHETVVPYFPPSLPKSEDEKLCTFTTSGKEYQHQPWYHCRTCSSSTHIGACITCARVCHADRGHDVCLARSSPSRFFCDCGSGDMPVSCIALVPRTPHASSPLQKKGISPGSLSALQSLFSLIYKASPAVKIGVARTIPPLLSYLPSLSLVDEPAEPLDRMKELIEEVLSLYYQNSISKQKSNESLQQNIQSLSSSDVVDLTTALFDLSTLRGNLSLVIETLAFLVKLTRINPNLNLGVNIPAYLLDLSWGAYLPNFSSSRKIAHFRHSWNNPILSPLRLYRYSHSSIVTDGKYLYIHNSSFGLMKVGSGFRDSVPGHVYVHNPNFHPRERLWLAYYKGHLLFRMRSMIDHLVTEINILTLETVHNRVICAGKLPPSLVYANFADMFSDGNKLYFLTAPISPSLIGHLGICTRSIAVNEGCQWQQFQYCVTCSEEDSLSRSHVTLPSTTKQKNTNDLCVSSRKNRKKSVNVCIACAKHCHKGHILRDSGYDVGSFICNCGIEDEEKEPEPVISIIGSKSEHSRTKNIITKTKCNLIKPGLASAKEYFTKSPIISNATKQYKVGDSFYITNPNGKLCLASCIATRTEAHKDTITAIRISYIDMSDKLSEWITLPSDRLSSSFPPGFIAWEWFDDKTWNPYDKETNTEIQSAFEDEAKKVKLTKGKFFEGKDNYVVHFGSSCYQENTTTGFRRNVRGHKLKGSRLKHKSRYSSPMYYTVWEEEDKDTEKFTLKLVTYNMLPQSFSQATEHIIESEIVSKTHKLGYESHPETSLTNYSYALNNTISIVSTSYQNNISINANDIGSLMTRDNNVNYLKTTLLLSYNILTDEYNTDTLDSTMDGPLCYDQFNDITWTYLPKSYHIEGFIPRKSIMRFGLPSNEIRFSTNFENILKGTSISTSSKSNDNLLRKSLRRRIEHKDDKDKKAKETKNKDEKKENDKNIEESKIKKVHLSLLDVIELSFCSLSCVFDTQHMFNSKLSNTNSFDKCNICSSFSSLNSTLIQSYINMLRDLIDICNTFLVSLSTNIKKGKKRSRKIDKNYQIGNKDIIYNESVSRYEDLLMCILSSLRSFFFHNQNQNVDTKSNRELWKEMRSLLWKIVTTKYSESISNFVVVVIASGMTHLYPTSEEQASLLLDIRTQYPPILNAFSSSSNFFSIWDSKNTTSHSILSFLLSSVNQETITRFAALDESKVSYASPSHITRPWPHITPLMKLLLRLTKQVLTNFITSKTTESYILYMDTVIIEIIQQMKFLSKRINTSMIEDMENLNIILSSSLFGILLPQIITGLQLCIPKIGTDPALDYLLSKHITSLLDGVSILNKSIEGLKKFSLITEKAISKHQEMTWFTRPTKLVVQIVDSEHPFYKPPGEITYLAVPNADCVKLEFDTRCSTPPILGHLSIQDASLKEILRATEPWPTEPILLKGNVVSLQWVFKYPDVKYLTEADSHWGFRIILSPLQWAIPLELSWPADILCGISHLSGSIATRLINSSPPTIIEQNIQEWLQSDLFFGGLNKPPKLHIDTGETTPSIEDKMDDNFVQDLFNGDNNNGASKLNHVMLKSVFGKPLIRTSWNNYFLKMERAVVSALLKYSGKKMIRLARNVNPGNISDQNITTLAPVWRTAYSVERWVLDRIHLERRWNQIVKEPPSGDSALLEFDLPQLLTFCRRKSDIVEGDLPSDPQTAAHMVFRLINTAATKVRPSVQLNVDIVDSDQSPVNLSVKVNDDLPTSTEFSVKTVCEEVTRRASVLLLLRSDFDQYKGPPVRSPSVPALDNLDESDSDQDDDLELVRTRSWRSRMTPNEGETKNKQLCLSKITPLEAVLTFLCTDDRPNTFFTEEHLTKTIVVRRNRATSRIRAFTLIGKLLNISPTYLPQSIILSCYSHTNRETTISSSPHTHYHYSYSLDSCGPSLMGCVHNAFSELLTVALNIVGNTSLSIPIRLVALDLAAMSFREGDAQLLFDSKFFQTIILLEKDLSLVTTRNNKIEDKLKIVGWLTCMSIFSSSASLVFEWIERKGNDKKQKDVLLLLGSIIISLILSRIEEEGKLLNRREIHKRTSSNKSTSRQSDSVNPIDEDEFERSSNMNLSDSEKVLEALMNVESTSESRVLPSNAFASKSDGDDSSDGQYEEPDEEEEDDEDDDEDDNENKDTVTIDLNETLKLSSANESDQADKEEVNEESESNRLLNEFNALFPASSDDMNRDSEPFEPLDIGDDEVDNENIGFGIMPHYEPTRSRFRGTIPVWSDENIISGSHNRRGREFGSSFPFAFPFPDLTDSSGHNDNILNLSALRDLMLSLPSSPSLSRTSRIGRAFSRSPFHLPRAIRPIVPSVPKKSKKNNINLNTKNENQTELYYDEICFKWIQLLHLLRRYSKAKSLLSSGISTYSYPLLALSQTGTLRLRRAALRSLPDVLEIKQLSSDSLTSNTSSITNSTVYNEDFIKKMLDLISEEMCCFGCTKKHISFDSQISLQSTKSRDFSIVLLKPKKENSGYLKQMVQNIGLLEYDHYKQWFSRQTTFVLWRKSMKRALSSQDEINEVNVLSKASLSSCIEMCRKLSSNQLVCKIIPALESRNDILARTNPKNEISGTASLILITEVVNLLRTLLSSKTWSKLVISVLHESLNELNKCSQQLLTNTQVSEISTLRPLASLFVLGAHSEILCLGARVESLTPAGTRQGTLVTYSPAHLEASVLFDGDSAPTLLKVDDITPAINEKYSWRSRSNGSLNLSRIALEQCVDILSSGLSADTIPQETNWCYALHSVLQTSVISVLCASLETFTTTDQTIIARLLPVLRSLSRAGPPSIDLKMLRSKAQHILAHTLMLKRTQKEEENDINQSKVVQNIPDSYKPKEDDQYFVLPFQPFINTLSPLPIGVGPDPIVLPTLMDLRSSRNVFSITDSTLEFSPTICRVLGSGIIRTQADDLRSLNSVIITSNHPVPINLSEFYFEVEIKSLLNSQNGDLSIGFRSVLSDYFIQCNGNIWMMERKILNMNDLKTGDYVDIYDKNYRITQWTSACVLDKKLTKTKFGFLYHYDEKNHSWVGKDNIEIAPYLSHCSGASPRIEDRLVTQFSTVFKEGDVIGCGVSNTNGCIFFTRNGLLLKNRIAFDNIPLSDFYPAIEFRSGKNQVSVNFGKRIFRFDRNSTEIIPKGLDSSVWNERITNYTNTKEKWIESENELQRIKKQMEQEILRVRREKATSMLPIFGGATIEQLVRCLILHGDDVARATNWAFDHPQEFSVLSDDSIQVRREQSHSSEDLSNQRQVVQSIVNDEKNNLKKPINVDRNSTLYYGNSYHFEDDIGEGDTETKLPQEICDWLDLIRRGLLAQGHPPQIIMNILNRLEVDQSDQVALLQARDSLPDLPDPPQPDQSSNSDSANSVTRPPTIEEIQLGMRVSISLSETEGDDGPMGSWFLPVMESTDGNEGVIIEIEKGTKETQPLVLVQIIDDFLSSCIEWWYPLHVLRLAPIACRNAHVGLSKYSTSMVALVQSQRALASAQGRRAFLALLSSPRISPSQLVTQESLLFDALHAVSSEYLDKGIGEKPIQSSTPTVIKQILSNIPNLFPLYSRLLDENIRLYEEKSCVYLIKRDSKPVYINFPGVRAIILAVYEQLQSSPCKTKILSIFGNESCTSIIRNCSISAAFPIALSYEEVWVTSSSDIELFVSPVSWHLGLAKYIIDNGMLMNGTNQLLQLIEKNLKAISNPLIGCIARESLINMTLRILHSKKSRDLGSSIQSSCKNVIDSLINELIIHYNRSIEVSGSFEKTLFSSLFQSLFELLSLFYSLKVIKSNEKWPTWLLNALEMTILLKEMTCNSGLPDSFISSVCEDDDELISAIAFDVSERIEDNQDNPINNKENVKEKGTKRAKLSFTPKVSVSDYRAWSRSEDKILVSLLTTRCDNLGIKTSSYEINIQNCNIFVEGILRETHIKYSPELICAHIKSLLNFNEKIKNIIPFINLRNSLEMKIDDAMTLGIAVSNCRDLIFTDLKSELLHFILDKSSAPSDLLRRGPLFIDRLSAASATKSIFEQALVQLNKFRLYQFRVPHTNQEKGVPHVPFDVKLTGEHVVGWDGPYRAFFTDVCNELQSHSSTDNHTNSTQSLFIRCPNGMSDLGENREKYVINPSKNSAEHLVMYRLLGRLMGVAVRTSVLMSLDLSALFWKHFTREYINQSDLEAIDAAVIDSIISPLRRCADENDFKKHFKETLNFSTYLSDRSKVQLVHNGVKIAVTYSNRLEYAKLVEDIRLKEGLAQTEAMRAGFGDVVPLALLPLFTWKELSEQVCGRPKIDVELLKRHTKYGSGLKEDDQLVNNFWQVLTEFSDENRRKFIEFVYAQRRLPSEEQFNRERIRMLISTLNIQSDKADDHLPKADTCFFNLKLPPYTSLEKMRQNLSIVVNSDTMGFGSIEDEQQQRAE